MAEVRFEIADINLDHASRILEITWGDGHKSVYPLSYLRRHCPCASCREFQRQQMIKGGLQLLSGPAATATDEMVDLQPVGLYAMQPVWSDGHSTGIFSFEYVREICPCSECQGG